MTLKQKVHQECLRVLGEKIAALKISLRELEDGAENDNKSSAGDKHETARAMMQLEQEKLSKQLNEALIQFTELEKIDASATHDRVAKGSLVYTNNGVLFLSIALGKIHVENAPVFVLSPVSPLGTKLIGLKSEDTATINGTGYHITRID